MKFLQQIPFAGSANLGSHPKVQKAIENENKSHIAIFLGQHQFHPGHFFWFLVQNSDHNSRETQKMLNCFGVILCLLYWDLRVYWYIKKWRNEVIPMTYVAMLILLTLDFLDSSWIEMGFPMGFLILGAGVSIFYFVPQLLLQGKCYTIDASSSSNFPFSHLFNFFFAKYSHLFNWAMMFYHFSQKNWAMMH